MSAESVAAWCKNMTDENECAAKAPMTDDLSEKGIEVADEFGNVWRWFRDGTGWRAVFVHGPRRTRQVPPGEGLAGHVARLVAYGRPEHEPCERGTVGCCISHTTAVVHECETW